MNEQTSIRISLADQTLELTQRGERIVYAVSTAKNGPGELFGSECTPRGLHVIRAKIGDSQPMGAVFVGRRWTGEIYNDDLDQQFPGRDWILSRILWLSGCEVGRNRLGQVDTMRRYIYIHGAPDHLIGGRPMSHGCIRMRNADVVDLFDRVSTGTTVQID